MQEKNRKREKKNSKKDNTQNLNIKKYNPDWIEEYKMMREELVNYLEKLQTVRNMMYVAIGAVFAFSISEGLPFLCVILPLFFILPAYLIAVDYWICVRKASAYLVVFHESYEDCPIHWESRHNMLKKTKNKKESFDNSILSSVSKQLIPYYACAAINMIVYGLRLYKYMSSESSSDLLDIRIDGFPVLLYIIMGVIILIILIIFFIRFSKGESYESFIKKFLLIKYREEQGEIGKYWSGGIEDERDIKSLSEIFQVVNRNL